MCDGSGKNRNDEECEKCGGYGRIDCDKCGGRGKCECERCDVNGKESCASCNGQGGRQWRCPECIAAGRI